MNKFCKLFVVVLAVFLASCTNNPSSVEPKEVDYEHEIADYTQTIRIEPNYADAYNKRDGIAYSNKGDDDRAIADYTQAIRIEPNNANAYNNRGNVYNNKGDYERAIADFNQVIRIEPNFANAKERLEMAKRALRWEKMK